MSKISKGARHLCLALLFVSSLAGCKTLTAIGAYESADKLAQTHNWTPVFLETPHFTLKTYMGPKRNPELPLIVYIEGDGYAWIDRKWVSPDPTPRSPFMLDIALKDQTYNAVYLARPCQYVIETGRGANCQTALWTDARFNAVVVDDMSVALDLLIAQRPHKGLILAGGSGGGTIAMLLAAQRQDITGIVTLSGLLNHDSWTNYHKISSLTQSLNPANAYQEIAHIPQLHLLAGEDDVIPPKLSKKEVAKLNDLSPETISWLEVAQIDHSCCWDHYWSNNYKTVIEGIRMKGPYYTRQLPR